MCCRAWREGRDDMLKKYGCFLVGLGIIIVLVCLAVFSPFSAWIFGLGKGDPDYALKWQQRLQPLPDPETAMATYSEVFSKRFENGEWIFGVCYDSHYSHWGGTVVVKDSSGRVRAFFGHVCGDLFLRHVFHVTKSNDEFYRFLTTEHDFQEYSLP
jgi:hypothetical protein